MKRLAKLATLSLTAGMLLAACGDGTTDDDFDDNGDLMEDDWEDDDMDEGIEDDGMDDDA